MLHCNMILWVGVALAQDAEPTSELASEPTSLWDLMPSPEAVGAPPETDVAAQQLPLYNAAVQQNMPDLDPVVPVAPRVPAPRPLRFVGMGQSRAVLTSLQTTNPFLDGQVLGRLGGSNGTTVSDETRAAYVEQRASGFFTYTPAVLDGHLSMDAAFEVDFLWGDQSYGTAGNTGGAFGGDQVNLQTRRLFTTIKPTMPAGHKLSLVAGLQFVADSTTEPASARPDDLFRTGGKLMFWGSEAAGLSAFGRYKNQDWEWLRYRLGAYTLYEDGASLPDDIALIMADFSVHPTYATWAGLHGWVVRDRSGGEGGGLLGSGPISPLASLQGAGTVQTEGEVIDADIAWVSADLAYNHDLSRGPLGATALALANVGRVYVEELADVPVMGFAANAELRLRYAAGAGSVLRVEGLYTSGDTPDDGAYNGVLTGNDWGIVGAVYASHGTLLLFSDPLAINRQVAVVSDVSAAGAGLLGLTGQVGYDLVPNRITAVVGGGLGRTLTESAAYGDPGPVGVELNGRLRTHPWLLSNLDLCFAVVTGTDQPATPWLGMFYFDWLAF